LQGFVNDERIERGDGVKRGDGVERGDGIERGDVVVVKEIADVLSIGINEFFYRRLSMMRGLKEVMVLWSKRSLILKWEICGCSMKKSLCREEEFSALKCSSAKREIGKSLS
jgi:hypothetical protein